MTDNDLETLEKQLADAEARAEKARPEALGQIGALVSGLQAKIKSVRRRAQETAAAEQEKAAQAATRQAERERQAPIEALRQEAEAERARFLGIMERYAQMAKDYDALRAEYHAAAERRAQIYAKALNLGLGILDVGADMAPTTPATAEARGNTHLPWLGGGR